MRTIVKKPEPDFWKEYRRHNPHIRYSDLERSEEGSDLRKKIRKYMIDNQYGLCAYCCREIDDEHSLNEHIAPQQQYPDKTMDYDNLVACCNADPDTCGKSKKTNIIQIYLYLHYKKIVKNIFLLVSTVQSQE